MPDILGFPVNEALALLASFEGGRPVRVVATSGYKQSEEMSAHTDDRVVGLRGTDTEILLITAVF